MQLFTLTKTELTLSRFSYRKITVKNIAVKNLEFFLPNLNEEQ